MLFIHLLFFAWIFFGQLKLRKICVFVFYWKCFLKQHTDHEEQTILSAFFGKILNDNITSNNLDCKQTYKRWRCSDTLAILFMWLSTDCCFQACLWRVAVKICKISQHNSHTTSMRSASRAQVSPSFFVTGLETTCRQSQQHYCQHVTTLSVYSALGTSGILFFI